jgi:hypothetical protein
MDYFNSEAYEKTSKLSTEKRIKATANIIDMEAIIRVILEDKKYYRTNRARIDSIYQALLTGLSSERPGAIVESNCYKYSNEALTWGDHAFWIIPNPKDPYRPHHGLVVNTTLLKGHREDDGFSKWFFIIMEPDNYRHVDALLYAFAGAFIDSIFQDITTPEEVFFPKHPCTVAHQLRIKESARKLPVFRKEVYNKEKRQWVTSDTLAMPYYMAANYFRKISMFIGFISKSNRFCWYPADLLIVWLTFYCFRRCSANNMNARLPEDERRRMMGQNPNSNAFFASCIHLYRC